MNAVCWDSGAALLASALPRPPGLCHGLGSPLPGAQFQEPPSLIGAVGMSNDNPHGGRIPYAMPLPYYFSVGPTVQYMLYHCIVLTSETREQALARVGRALADPTRCRLLLAIVDGVAYPGHLADHLGLTKANVSNHLACLRDCGLVTPTYEGRRVRYDIADGHLASALTELAQVVLAVTPTDYCLNDKQKAPLCSCDSCVRRTAAVKT